MFDGGDSSYNNDNDRDLKNKMAVGSICLLHTTGSGGHHDDDDDEDACFCCLSTLIWKEEEEVAMLGGIPHLPV